MKLTVDKEKCIGCGNCVRICEDVFDFDDDGQAQVVESPISDDNTEDATEAMESCPTQAISEE